VPPSDLPPAGLDEAAVDDAILRAESITKKFRVRNVRSGGHHNVRAVSDVSFSLRPARVLALVGESGCGKSTVARLLAGLHPLTSGAIRLRGEPVSGRSERARRRYTRHVQIILQDPFSSLNASYRVRHHLIRPLLLHDRARRGELEGRAIELLEEVNLSPGRDFLDRYPHELSGGQRQRVSIARALAVEPQVLLADEPVSMLDVSIRLGILRLLSSITTQRGLALLYITHDIASARYFADETAVMYAGELVESGPSEDVTQNPQHPYTRLLVSAVPNPDRAVAGIMDTVPRGEPPDLTKPAPGCLFAARCPMVMERCRQEPPPRFTVGDGHWARCFIHAEPVK
jgi:peptide/nickel transport system ATP-binding protein